MPRIYTRRPAIDRFWEKVEILPSGCWRWVGAIQGQGYGNFWDGERYVRAHNFAYTHFIGPIPPKHENHHGCDNTWCVNPFHVEPLTPKQHRHVSNGFASRQLAQTHCKRGHPLSGDNLKIRVNSRGSTIRDCRECLRIRQHRYNQTPKGQAVLARSRKNANET